MALRPVSNVFKEASPTHGSPRAAPGARVVHMRFCAFPKGTPIVKVLTLGACLFFFLGGFYFELLQIIIRLTDGQGGFFPFTTLKKAVDIYEGLLTFQPPISLNEVLTMIDVASLSTLDLALRK